jgi:prephenate dehydrogenase
MMTIGIIGTGMIGGSIGIRARELGWSVLGFDRDPEAAQEARVRGAIDQIATHDDIVQHADVIVIAAHISGTLAEIEHLRSTPPRKARLIIDISSVKAPIVAAASGLRNFVATHPMAGRERSGPAAATRDVFEGKTWLYVPSGDRDLDWRAVEFIGAFGAIPVEADAVQHDRIVALTSHLPQVVATLFASRLSDDVAAFMGPTAKELQRLSRSSDAMWRDILEANRENICAELRSLAKALDDTATALERRVWKEGCASR